MLTRINVSYLLLCYFLSYTLSCSSLNKHEEGSKSFAVKWVDSIIGDFSFNKNWSYPLGVEMKKDGNAGCADGGFCPERCYSMLDKDGIVLIDSAEIFYQLLDTTHEYYSLDSEAWSYEWAGTNFIDCTRLGLDSVICFTRTNIGTHCWLQILIVKDEFYATLHLNSIVQGMDTVFYCTDGLINIDSNLWKKNILKSDFNFNFGQATPMHKAQYWKGKTYSIIQVPVRDTLFWKNPGEE